MHYRRQGVRVVKGLGPSPEINPFCPQNDKFECILTQLLTGRKHSRQKSWDMDFAIRS